MTWTERATLALLIYAALAFVIVVGSLVVARRRRR
jgi:hypothetical protein